MGLQYKGAIVLSQLPEKIFNISQEKMPQLGWRIGDFDLTVSISEGTHIRDHPWTKSHPRGGKEVVQNVKIVLIGCFNVTVTGEHYMAVWCSMPILCHVSMSPMYSLILAIFLISHYYHAFFWPPKFWYLAPFFDISCTYHWHNLFFFSVGSVNSVSRKNRGNKINIKVLARWK